MSSPKPPGTESDVIPAATTAATTATATNFKKQMVRHSSDPSLTSKLDAACLAGQLVACSHLYLSPSLPPPPPPPPPLPPPPPPPPPHSNNSRPLPACKYQKGGRERVRPPTTPMTTRPATAALLSTAPHHKAKLRAPHPRYRGSPPIRLLHRRASCSTGPSMGRRSSGTAHGST